MKVMSYFQLAVLFFVGFGCSVVRSQAEQFEYECDILQRLDTIENKLTASDQLITVLQNKAQESEDTIALLQNKAQESEETIALLQNKAHKSEETIALLQNKAHESEETIALLQNKAQDSEETIILLQNKAQDSEATITLLQNMAQELDETFRAQQETIETLQNKTQKSDETITSLTQQLREKTAVGSTYVRWGRTSCPGHGSELVYQGVAGGSWFEHSGAAAEYLCLPLEPEYRNYTEDALQSSGLVYGAEYEFTDRTNRMKFFFDIDASPDLLQQNVPCAVCHVSRNTMIMIPAKRTCTDGWTREYEGLLVSGHYYNPSATEYICLDDRPEVIPSGGSNQNGKVLYFVEGRCGSLPCPQYVDGRELSCVVCTK